MDFDWKFTGKWKTIISVETIKWSPISWSLGHEAPNLFLLDLNQDNYWVSLNFHHTSKKRKSLPSLLPSPTHFAGKVRKSQQQNFATKVGKSWNKANIYKKVGLLKTLLCNVGESETTNMFLRHLWHFFTILWHIFKAIALIQQSKFGSFYVLRL